MKWLAIVLALGIALAPLPTRSHEVRPAYLELSEDRPSEFSVAWKTPMVGNLRLALDPAFSGPVVALTPVATRTTDTSAVQTWRLRADRLRGQKLRIDGLEATLTDTLVRIVFADGSAWVGRLTPQQPEVVIPLRPSAWSVAGAYLVLGVEHILTGIDHLLFVLALMLLANGTWQLLKTVTAFTAAHSITLALATLGIVQVPSKPVESVIALSIVFVAAEVVRAHRGQIDLAARMPWIVALSFGLLHGLGFAGALSEVGLPEGQIPVALLFFNIGVEAGQLLFIAGVLAVAAAARRLRMAWPRWAELVPAYAIGSVAMVWVFQRVADF